MFIVLPPTVFFLIFLYRIGALDDAESQDRPWQGEFLIAAAVWGALLVAITEGLSLFSSINRQWLAVCWSIVLIAAIAMGWRNGRIALGWKRMRRGFPLKSRLEYLYLGIFLSIAGLLFLVAFVSPPSNVDALQYHMPRAVHWAQNQSLGHYPASHLGQNVRPYWAEAAILHLRVLWGNDQPANLVQWFSMIGSVIAATGIAAILGGKRRAQWLTAAFAISIPMGVLQAATTQNDYVSAFWVVCLAYFVILSKKREISKVELLGLSLSLGLGMLTKGTFFPFAGPLMIWFLVPRIFKANFKKTLAELVVIGFIAASLNAAFWSRNIMTFGGPYGSSLPIKVFERGFETPQDGFTLREQKDVSTRSDESNHPEIDQYTTSGIKSLSITASLINADIHGMTSLSGEFRTLTLKLIRMVMMNFVTPFHWFNTRLFIAMESFPEIFPEGYIKSLEWAAWNHEMTAGNPLHLGLLILSMIGAGLIERKRKEKWILQYSIIVIAGYILLTPIDYSGWIFSIRYQLTFFVLGAPIFGIVFEKLDKKIVSLFTICLLLYAVPYVLYSNMRPVIGHPPWPTRIGSVFTTDQTEILFAQSPEIRDEYMVITERIQEESCGEVGISISKKDLEYSFWWLLEAPQSGIHIRHVEAPPSLEKYLDPAFAPCAIICTDCQGAQDFHQLPIAIEAGHVQLFLESD